MQCELGKLDTMTKHPLPLLRLITPAELAKYLRVSERTLENWRHQNIGAAYCRLGPHPHHKVVYDWEAVASWIAQHSVMPDAHHR